MAIPGLELAGGILARMGWPPSIDSEVAAQLYVNEELDGDGNWLHLDKVGSVSGARRDEPYHVWDDQLLDEQYRRFLNSLEVCNGVAPQDGTSSDSEGR